MNRWFILNQPKSKSNLVCVTCQHLYDDILNVCNCIDPKEVKDGEEPSNKPIRRIMLYKEFVKEKFGGK